MSPFQQGFYMAAGVACFVALVLTASWLLGVVADLIAEIFLGPGVGQRYARMPETESCPTCGWRPAVFIPQTTIVHLPDGTHDAKTKED